MGGLDSHSSGSLVRLCLGDMGAGAFSDFVMEVWRWMQVHTNVNADAGNAGNSFERDHLGRRKPGSLSLKELG